MVRVAFAADFFGAGFLAADFLVADFLAAAFFVARFFVLRFAAAFLLARFFGVAFGVVAFAAVFLVAGFFAALFGLLLALGLGLGLGLRLLFERLVELREEEDFLERAELMAHLREFRGVGEVPSRIDRTRASSGARRLAARRGEIPGVRQNGAP